MPHRYLYFRPRRHPLFFIVARNGIISCVPGMFLWCGTVYPHYYLLCCVPINTTCFVVSSPVSACRTTTLHANNPLEPREKSHGGAGFREGYSGSHEEEKRMIRFCLPASKVSACSLLPQPNLITLQFPTSSAAFLPLSPAGCVFSQDSCGLARACHRAKVH